MDKEKIKKLNEIINKSKHLVFFGGAGTSTESGIPDFRSKEGIFNTLKKFNKRPEELLSHTALYNDTKTVYKYYIENFIKLDKEPNALHKGLKKLEDKGILKALITQNVDDLHEKAGSKNIIKLHGSVLDVYCDTCLKKYPLESILNKKTFPKCEVKGCNGMLRPDVVFYEEALNEENMKNSILNISMADTLIIGGTSLIVYPAASLVNYFRGENLILINKDDSSKSFSNTLVINEKIGEVFSQLEI